MKTLLAEFIASLIILIAFLFVQNSLAGDSIDNLVHPPQENTEGIYMPQAMSKKEVADALAAGQSEELSCLPSLSAASCVNSSVSDACEQDSVVGQCTPVFQVESHYICGCQPSSY